MKITLEATHHGPVTSTPTMFVEIGMRLCASFFFRFLHVIILQLVFFAMDPLESSFYSLQKSPTVNLATSLTHEMLVLPSLPPTWHHPQLLFTFFKQRNPVLKLQVYMYFHNQQESFQHIV